MKVDDNEKQLNRPPKHVLADVAVSEFERAVLSVGWVWNPTRSGSDYGIDGFVTPCDDTGHPTPFEIPIQVKGVGNLRRSATIGTGNPVTREAVNILRAHVLGGYFVVFDGQEKELFYVHADEIGASFDKSSTYTKPLKVNLKDRILPDSLIQWRDLVNDKYLRLQNTLKSANELLQTKVLYVSLNSIQSNYSDILAEAIMASPEQLMNQIGLYFSMDSDDARKNIKDAINEYEIKPPGYYENFYLTCGLIQTLNLSIDHFIEVFKTKISNDKKKILVDELGIMGFQASIRLTTEKMFKDKFINIINLHQKTGIHKMHVNMIHFFIGISQISLLLNRFLFELGKVVFPDLFAFNSENELVFTPPFKPEVWIRHIEGIKTDSEY